MIAKTICPTRALIHLSDYIGYHTKIVLSSTLRTQLFEHTSSFTRSKCFHTFGWLVFGVGVYVSEFFRLFLICLLFLLWWSLTDFRELDKKVQEGEREGESDTERRQATS